MKTQITGARIVLETLAYLQVEYIFGYPGGSVIPIYNELYGFNKLKHIFVRHEQGAAHAADGYARISQKVGVCLATSGPGATNLVTGIMTAHMDSVPIVAITGQAQTKLLGKDAFQESDILNITMPITKHNFLVTDILNLPSILKKAFIIANSGRKGPVLVDIPRDIQVAKIPYSQFEQLINEPTINIYEHQKYHQVKYLAGNEALTINLLAAAKRPIILAGHGVLLANASLHLQALAKHLDAPVVNTLLGLGSIPASNQLSLGMAGMHGSVWANFALDEADLVIAVGMRFDDRMTGDTGRFLNNARIIHIDIDKSEIHKNIPVDSAIIADAKAGLQYLKTITKASTHEKWRDQIANWRQRYPLPIDSSTLTAKQVIAAISNMTNGNANIITDVGQHQMWTAQYYQFERANAFCSSGGGGTMGYGVPASIGSAFADSKHQTISIVGDGGVQMTSQEFMTIAQYNLPIKTIIMNNGFLGMVRQWQELFNDHRYSFVDLSINPDFALLAQAYYHEYVLIKSTSDFDKLHTAIKSDKPVIIECIIQREENVFPMIPAGLSVSELTLGGDIPIEK